MKLLKQKVSTSLYFNECKYLFSAEIFPKEQEIIIGYQYYSVPHNLKTDFYFNNGDVYISYCGLYIILEFKSKIWLNVLEIKNKIDKLLLLL